jgi:hypothetical protein
MGPHYMLIRDAKPPFCNKFYFICILCNQSIKFASKILYEESGAMFSYRQILRIQNLYAWLVVQRTWLLLPSITFTPTQLVHQLGFDFGILLVHLAYKSYFFSQRTVFFFHNKSANNTFSQANRAYTVDVNLSLLYCIQCRNHNMILPAKY